MTKGGGEGTGHVALRALRQEGGHRVKFTAFCHRLRVHLEPAQLVLARVGFDGMDPCDLEPAEREIARQLFGPVERFAAEHRAVLAVVIGGRAGKSYILIALRCLHLALTVDLSTLAPGQIAYGNIIAPDLDLASEALGYIRGAINSDPMLKKIAVDGADDDSKSLAITLRRGAQKVVIKCRSSTGKGGRTGRGRSLFFVGMDEAALFYDSDYKYNDKDIFDANQPRVIPGGQTVVGSTPWAETGVLYELYRDNHGHPTTAMCAHAPTTLMRDAGTPNGAHVLQQVAAAYARDPENAAREFGARFMAAGTSQFFDGPTLRLCLDDEKPIAFGVRTKPGLVVTAGGDFGFARNASTLAICARDGDVYELAALEERKATPGAPLVPSVVIREFADITRAHGTQILMADQHYRETVREHLFASGLVLLDAPAQQSEITEAYVRVRTLMREGKIRLPKHDRLFGQLREVTAKFGSGGTMRVSSPDKPDGSHGDLVAALVLAIWQAWGARIEAPRLNPDSAEGAKEAERRHLAKVERDMAQRNSRWSWAKDR